MPGYPNTRPPSNPTALANLVPLALRAPADAATTDAVDEFGLTPPPRVTKRNLYAWIERAIVGVKPRVWSVAARLARTWGHNPHPGNGSHSLERFRREDRLKANLERFAKYRRVLVTARMLPRNQASVNALVGQGLRLVNAGVWSEAETYRSVVNNRRRTTMYLPQDTWSAESAFDYVVCFLARHVAALTGVTEKKTPRYTAGSTGEPLRSGTRALTDESWARWYAARQARWCGEQPPLPAIS